MSFQGDSPEQRDEGSASEASQGSGTLRTRLSSTRPACASELTESINSAIASLGEVVRGRSSVATIFAAVLITVSLVVAPIAVVSAEGEGPLIHIPSPTPGDDKHYNDTYRVYANNDEDISPKNISHSGYFESDYPLGPVELGKSSKSPSQVLRYAATADVYVTEVSMYDAVPIQDRWVTYSSMPFYSETEFLNVHTRNSYDGPKSNDGQRFVRVTNPYGEFRPVYNADVEWDENAGEFYVSNPDEALVHRAYYGSNLGRSHHVAGQYTKYAQDSDRVAVPMKDGNELYPTSSGASMSRKWGQNNYDTVEDAWVGINEVYGGVWYRGRYVSGGSPTRGAVVPFDHRASAPPDYSKSDQCSKNHRHSRTITVGDTTKTVSYSHTHYYPRTKWAEYDLIDSTAEVTSVRLDKPDVNGNFEWSQFGDTTWLAIEPNTSKNFQYPRGDYTLTATLTVTSQVKTRWGITSSKCNEWTKTSVDNYTHKTQYEVPITLTDFDSPNLDIDVVHIDGEGKDRLIVTWAGDQDLPSDPWRKIQVDIGNKTVDIESPWRFYGVSRNDEVEIRTGNKVSSKGVTHSHDDRWPAIFHYETSVGNVTAGFPQKDDKDQAWGYTKTVDSQVEKTLSGSPLPAGVNDPDNDNPTDLYAEQVIEVRSSDLKSGETAHVRANNPWGASVDSSISSQPYEPTTITFTDINTSKTGKGHTATLALTDSAGNPIQNADLNVSNGDGTTSTVTTNSTGHADVDWDGMIVRADYEGSVWWDPNKPYYKESTALKVVEPSFEFKAVSDVGEYLSASISNVLIFAEWLLLGLFALWWVRMRRRSSNEESG